ncbi:MAG TPA: PRC-barrel domain-containing protein [Acidimicrobiia bacterium]
MTMANALSASTITGDTVRNSEGDEIGKIEEIVLDLDRGRVAYAVLASGGFLGMGNKFFAIPWDRLRVDMENKEVVLDIDKDLLKNAPGFDKDNWPDASDNAWVADVYRYYQSTPYWDEPIR